jgi:hypothetical protein
MMGTPCLRYKDDFIAMMLEKEGSFIIKVSDDCVNEIIENGEGNKFNFTKKKFKEWVLIPSEFEKMYKGYVLEALVYVRGKINK